MIEVTDLNGEKRIINSDLIETIDAVPDTIVKLVNGHRFYAKETPMQLVERIVDFRKACGPTSARGVVVQQALVEAEQDNQTKED